MAEMIPESITYLSDNDSEKRVFDILKDTLKPDDDYIAWYEPKILNRFGNTLKPDFIVWSQNYGLSVLEIKGWSIDYFLGAKITNDEIILKNGIRLKNPEKQSLEYMNDTMSNLKKIPKMLKNSGHLKFPCGYGIILPNITRNEFEERLKTVINPEKTLTADDILKIETGDKIILSAFLRKIRNVNISFQPLNPEELKTLRNTLYPGVEIPTTITNYNHENAVKILDREQEKEAYKIGPGHRIIKGVAGSGKTLLIAYRAKILKKINPTWKILIICYNITLEKYINEFLLKNIQLGSDCIIDNDIEVIHFHEFIRKFHGITLNTYPREKWGDYQNRLCLALRNKIDNGEIKGEVYDAILIDECQDLVTDYVKFLVYLLKKDTNHLLIAFDPEQNVYNYGEGISWRSLGIEARGGRIKELKKSYRNTNEILLFAKKFKPQNTDAREDEIYTPLFPEFSARHGEKPTIKSFDNDSSIVDYIIEIINYLTTKHKLKYSEIGILFTNKNTLYNRNTRKANPFSYYNSLTSKLLNTGIPYKEIIDQRDKKDFKYLDDSIKIITIHSVKGYEFKAVFLLNLENDWIHDELRRSLIYVGITRAQDFLYIPYLNNGRYLDFISEMERINSV